MVNINLNIAKIILNGTDQNAALKNNKNRPVFMKNSAGKDKNRLNEKKI